MTDTTIAPVAADPRLTAMTPQLAQAYKDATDNLMYLKKEQVQITYYTWLLLAALYIISRNYGAASIVRTVLAAGTLLVWVLSTFIIWDFHRSMAKFRRRLRYIYETYFDDKQRKGLGLDASDHYFMTILSLLVCAVASLFTFAIILGAQRIRALCALINT
jgi:hypothetical protein